ncbi:MAG TPA: hypothetical protein VF777_01345 [Phycisphaerales bacterium]
MNTAKPASAAGTTLSSLATEGEGSLVAAVERDYPLASKAVCNPWTYEWAHLPSIRAVWSESLEGFVDVDWRSACYHWYLRVCAFELVRTDHEGGEPPAAFGAGDSGGPTGAAVGTSRKSTRYSTGPLMVATVVSWRAENL